MRITLCLILIALCRSADAAGPGTTAANFLRIGAGARAAGMGEAYTGIADEVNSIYWNPAGMSLMKTKEASFMHAVWLEGINYQHFAYGHPVAKLGTFGIALDYLSMSPIDRTGIDTTGGLDAPVFTGETYSPADTAFTIGYAKKINRISGGVNIKLINSRIDEETATAFAADFGGIYNFGKTLTLGLAIKNAGTQIKYRETSHPLPTDIK
ncbi:MAG: PorV/PorQ family protein, partial [Elusimicrobiota bacterium]